MKGKKLKTADIALVSLFTALLCVGSWVSIPFGAVPVTLQTFVLYVATAVLGARKSAVSVIVYLLCGLTGSPVFSGFRGGFSVLAGPTGGYILGFLFISIVSGLLIEKCKDKKYVIFTALLTGTLFCYIFGTLWYMFVYADGAGFREIILACVLPFIIPDIVKIVLATFVAKSIKKRVRI